ncbi:SusC/RagA family TonB-linked outer membrane protein [Autumnicola musiva]|uniref:TonB-dependent receptor n=1 Tax=Autumnicola musiva TaxID=3075589 RepID=A0ABU3DAJ7_9FLAO|nr:TonB-dependent receptor [Zunongwangia sp. F117]MDT0678552.1 TonB-dependent receptor [Zunongwangia sp. F117]
MNSKIQYIFSFFKGISFYLLSCCFVIVSSSAATKAEPYLKNVGIRESFPFEKSTNIFKNIKRNTAQEVITGTVLDESGLPLPGVNITEKGTTNGTQTDFDGNFTIQVASSEAILVFSFLGFEKQEIPVQGRINVKVILSENVAQMEEVVIIGYGQQERRDVTGSISSISPEALPVNPVEAPDRLMKGRMPGVFISQNSGQPGGTTTMRIRGGTSINAGNDPLFIVDGVPLDMNAESSSAGVASGGSLNPLTNINPSDIKSISVLKDASATAIYGSRGANGVVIITTKTGVAGRTMINFNSSFSLQKVRKTIPLLDATEFARYRNEVAVKSGDEPIYSEQEINSLGRGTDWQDEVFRTALLQNYSLSISGGNEKTRYYMSGSYTDQQGIIINSDLKNLNFRVNLDTEVTDNVRVGNALTLARTNSDIVNTSTATSGSASGIVFGALSMDPTLPIYHEDGTYILSSEDDTPNPVAHALELTNEVESTRLLNNLYVEFDLTENLLFRSAFGINLLDNNENYFKPSTIYLAGSLRNTARVGAYQKEHWTSSNTITFNSTFGETYPQSLELLGGITIDEENTEVLRAGASGFPTNDLKYYDLSSGTVFNAPQTFVDGWNLISYLGRANYTFNDKYLLTASARYDGSSRFGAGNKFGFFPSGAIGWRISNEEFMQTSNIFSDLKLRASYGKTGNQEIGNYGSLSLLSTVNVLTGDQARTGIYPRNIANPDLKWETTDQFDVGVDMELWNNAISITADYYKKTTTDLLLNVPIPWTTGFSDALVNLGELKNEGVELAINANTIRFGEARLNLSFNAAKNKSEILNLGDIEPFFVGESIIREGLPLGSFFGYVYEGVFQNEQEIENSAQPEAQPGDERFADLNEDGRINAEDRQVIGNAQPDIIGGFSGKLFYKNFELSARFNYSVGNEIYNETRRHLESLSGSTKNQSVVALNRWTPDNPSNTIPAARRGRPGYFSDRYIEDGSYLRMQDLTLAYVFPTNLLEKLNFKNIMIFVSGENLLTVTDYSGFDPEVSGYGQNALSQGIDQDVYPTAKTFRIGLQLGF